MLSVYFRLLQLICSCVAGSIFALADIFFSSFLSFVKLSEADVFVRDVAERHLGLPLPLTPAGCIKGNLRYNYGKHKVVISVSKVGCSEGTLTCQLC